MELHSGQGAAVCWPTSWGGGRDWFLAFVDFSGVNTSTMVNFQLPKNSWVFTNRSGSSTQVAEAPCEMSLKGEVRAGQQGLWAMREGHSAFSGRGAWCDQIRVLKRLLWLQCWEQMQEGQCGRWCTGEEATAGIQQRAAKLPSRHVEPCDGPALSVAWGEGGVGGRSLSLSAGPHFPALRC